MRFFKTPLGTTALVIGVCLLTLLIFEACRKLEPEKPPITSPGNASVEKFFQIPAGTHPGVVRIADEIKRQNKDKNFLPTFIRNQGFLLWDKARVFPIPPAVQARLGGGGGDTSYIIPLVLEGTHRVNGFVTALPKDNDSTIFRLYDATTYKSHYGDTDSAGIEAKEMAMLCMLFEENIFGHRTFKITDSNLMRYSSKPVGYLKIEQSPMSRLVAMGTWYYCYTVWVTNDNGQVVGCPPGDDNCNAGQSQEICESLTIWGFDDMYDDIPGGGGGGSTGGGESGWFNPCRAIDTIPGTSAGNVCTSGGPLGWIAWEDLDEQTTFNANAYDSVVIESPLRNGYPCYASIIEDSLDNANWIAQMAGENIFSEAVYTHLKFDTSTTDTGPGQRPGYTSVGGSFGYDGNGNFHMTATIYLNGWYLRNSSHEYNISTIVHEAMHAVIVVRWAQYQLWLMNGSGNIDSNYLKQHFPIHWAYFASAPPNTVPQVQQHILMANDYMNTWMDIGRQYYNPSAPPAVRDSVLMALGQSALLQTSAWNLLPSQGYDTCKIKKYERTAWERLSGSFGMSGCPNFTIDWQSDLYLRNPCQ